MRKFALTFYALILLCLPAAAMADEVPRPEFPRPDFVREAWQNLNGQWEFAFDPDDKGLDEKWFERESLPDRITVPYPVESELSGVHVTDPPNVCWYLKKFDIDEKLLGPGSGTMLLNFGAADYKARVWLNGKMLGEHTGGYTPFSFNVTGAARPTDNVLVVRIYDSKDRMQVRGKQTPKEESYLIMYTKVTGLWQTVWLERAGDPYIKSYRFMPSKDLSGGLFTVEVAGSRPYSRIVIEIIGPDGNREPAGAVRWIDGKAVWLAVLSQPWSPDYPALYQVRLYLKGNDGETLDRVDSYVGLRTIDVTDGKIRLNGKPFYQKLLLDQGYFPGGIYTPKDDGAMRADVEMYKRMGFNGLRKHQKIEDPRFLYWCDKLGLVVWEEMPSVGFGLPRRVPGWARSNFRQEWLAAIARDLNHPCIITWTVYNETWGIYEMPWHKPTRDWAYEMVRLTREADPTRLVVDNSGGWHFDTDIWDFHHYLPTVEKSRKLYEKYDFQPGDRIGYGWYMLQLLKGEPMIPLFLPRKGYWGEPIFLSEYGGFGYYRTEGDKTLLDMYRDYTLALKDYPYIQGYCYTQPYDVEQEQNGLMTFDREPKVDPEQIKAVNDQMGY